MPRVLVIGSINMDLVCCMDALPPRGASVMGTRFEQLPGGKGANSAVAAARLGGEVTFVGCVGADDAGAILKDGLAREGVDVSMLRAAPDAPTGRALIMVEEGGHNRIVVYPGANMRITADMLDEAFERPYDAVMMQLEIPHEIVFEASRRAAERGIPVVIDAGPAQPFAVQRVRGLEILSPNETEMTALTGLPVDTDAEARAASLELLRTSGARYVVLKMGARGCFACGGGLDVFVPAFRIGAVDPTAAGDTFTGAMTLRYVETGDLRGALLTACAAGALCASRLGAQPSLPTRAEVDAMLRA